MLSELHEKLDQQYNELYPKTDWKEIVGSTIAVILLGVFVIAYFVLAI